MAKRKRKIVKAGGWELAKRLIKPIPIIGSIVAVGLAGYAIKKKGFLRGSLHVGLDVTPVVGTAKNVVEIFTGDLIRDKVSNKPALAESVTQPSQPSQEFTPRTDKPAS
ncbi:MAG: hypothetical protein M3Y84_13395 [Acidobacteriota bacterium]|nr:hypothetical protein [Acidobacteriota bacterium]